MEEFNVEMLHALGQLECANKFCINITCDDIALANLLVNEKWADVDCYVNIKQSHFF